MIEKEELNKIHNKLDVLDTRLDSIDRTLVGQHEQLKHHIKRTDQGETRLNHIENMMTQVVLKHINQVDGALKLLGVLSLLSGFVVGALKLAGII